MRSPVPLHPISTHPISHTRTRLSCYSLYFRYCRSSTAFRSHVTHGILPAAIMQLTAIITLSLSSLAAANVFDSIGQEASSLGQAASSLAASYSSEYSRFTATATATGGAAASSYIASLESAASAAIASISSKEATMTSGVTPKISATTVTTTDAQGMTVTRTSYSTGGAALPTGAVGAMLLGGAAVFAAVL
ncbi:hypothetical protein BUE80_DR004004 [Diplocarpon rosae]|nr:hypothetical protein BUE80_DR004004 [Diplocarpon rosae]